jgi:creatinine amidohydrolase
MPEARVTVDALAWAEAEAVLRGADVVLLPLGARMKEHGHHLPLNNDWILAERLADHLVAAVADDVRVARLPALDLGFYPAFVAYPGLHLRRSTAIAVLEDIGDSLLRTGVRRLYVLNTGISTVPTLEAARLALADRGLAVAYTDLHTHGKAARDAVRRQAEGSHADELETSMMLALAPEVVKLDRAVPCVGPAGPGPLSRDPANPGGLYSPSGVYGDPTLATREKGEVLVAGLVADLAVHLRGFARGT